MTKKALSDLLKGVNNLIEATETSVATYNSIRDKLLVIRALLQMGCVRYKEILGEITELKKALEKYAKELHFKLE